MIHILFVCLGNICRSPMAEAIMRHKVQAAGLAERISVDSAGTSSYHVGERPHPGTLRILDIHGIDYTHRSQQISEEDLAAADYLVAMDRANLKALRRMDRPGVADGKLSLLLEHAPHLNEQDVPDPYYENNFDRVYQLVEQGCAGLLRRIREEHDL